MTSKLVSLFTLFLTLLQTPGAEDLLDCGPFIGHVETTRATIWARFNTGGVYRLSLAGVEKTFEAIASPDHDLCLIWELDNLKPDTDYLYTILDENGAVVRSGPDYHFRTANPETADVDLSFLIGSCAYEDAGTAETWRQASRENIDVILLIGDTPYIDTSNLQKQRQRYAAFARFPEMAKLLHSTPWYGTWDDHDFGLGDGDGRLVGKENSRQAFQEYHANPTYGEHGLGIYTKFRRGPVEVFLLDTRYFAATEPSPYLKHHASLLGKAQWDWLRSSLKSSSAPIKLLTCGMIWNAATRPNKQDHWGSYPHELNALFKFIGDEKIEGVVLVGGDIHRSRVLRHDTKDVAGYDIYELISSPMHGSIIETANAPHPHLIKDMGEPYTFLILDVEQHAGKVTNLQARFVNASGTEHFKIGLLD